MSTVSEDIYCENCCKTIKSCSFYKHRLRCNELYLQICKSCHNTKLYATKQVAEHEGHELENHMTESEQSERLKSIPCPTTKRQKYSQAVEKSKGENQQLRQELLEKENVINQLKSELEHSKTSCKEWFHELDQLKQRNQDLEETQAPKYHWMRMITNISLPGEDNKESKEGIKQDMKELNKKPERAAGAGGQSSIFILDFVDGSRRVAKKFFHQHEYEKESVAQAKLNHLSFVRKHHPEIILPCFLLRTMIFDYYQGTLNTANFKTAKDYCNLFQEMVRMLQKIHEEKIIHLDLKASNFFFTKDEFANVQLFIGDFGLSRFAEDKDTKVSAAGTKGYIAPELQQRQVSYLSDVYSLGITFASMLAGSARHKFMDKVRSMTFDTKSTKQSRTNTSVIYPAGFEGDVIEHLTRFTDIDIFFKLIKRMIQIDPQDRINLTEVGKELQNIRLLI